MFGEKEKQEIAQFALEHGHVAAVRKFKKKFLTLTKNLKEKRKGNKDISLEIGQTRRRPLLLDIRLDSKLQEMIIYLRMAGTGINQQVVGGVFIGLV